MIYLLLDRIFDKYIQENFRKLQTELNKEYRARPFPSYSNLTRPITGLSKGDTIFNTDDNFLNTWDGTQWRDPTGAVT